MRNLLYLLLVLAAMVALSACGSTPGKAASGEVTDQASLIEALEAVGAKVELQDRISQEFFTPEGQLMLVDEAGIQVYEYESAEEMEAEAALVAPDGGSIGTSMVNWVEPPHFYKAGRLVVLYLGSDEEMMNLLESLMGAQFAGR